jgi:aminomethyltransferase
MPLMYTSVAEEHLAVREAAGLFDVSHMGEFSVRGPGAVDFLQHMTSNDVTKLPVGGIQYSTILNERGGVKDDVLVHRIEEQGFIIVCNAVNVDKLNRWFAQHRHREVTLEDISPTTVMLALQGPKAQRVLQPLTELDLAKLKRHKAAQTEVVKAPVLVSRSGYTGEDGFELFIFDESPTKPVRAETVWNTLLQAGKDAGIKPCGLGARDTTRLEAGLCLYGNELTEDTTPLEAKIDFVVRFDKGEFIGYAPLLEQKIVGPKHVRVGLRMVEAGVPRQGYEIFMESEKVGAVTSGTFSPLLKVGIAMGYAKPGLKVGDKLSVEIRGKRHAAEVVNWPFYNPARYGYLGR